MTDRRIADAFERLAAEAQPVVGGWAAIERRIHHRHRAKLFATVITSVAIVATTVAIVPRIGSGRDRMPIVSPPEQPSPSLAGFQPEPLDSVLAFADGENGWAGGRGGIFETSDGGRTWRLQLRRPGVAWIDVIDYKHAFAAVEKSVYGTRDGETWQQLATSRQELRYVDFVDGSVGWRLDVAGRMERSTDGGSTWSPAPTPEPFTSMCFLGADTGLAGLGYAVSNSRLYETHDSGRTWQGTTLNGLRSRAGDNARSAPVPMERANGTVRCGGQGATALFYGGAAAGSQAYEAWQTDKVGWVIVAMDTMRRDPSDQTTPTIDAYAGPFTRMRGGPIPDQPGLSRGRHSGGLNFFVGGCDPCDPGPRVTIASGTDAPDDWKRYEPATLRGLDIRSIYFVIPTHGWVLASIGRDGVVFATTDGGRTWTRQFASPALAPPGT